LQGRVIVKNNVAAAIDAIGLMVKVVDDLKFITVPADSRCEAIVIEIQ
jgi:hypothetical protein